MKNFKLIIFVLGVLFLTPMVSSQRIRVPYTFTLSTKIQPRMGAENTLLFYQLYGLLDEQYIPTKIFDDTDFLSRSGNIFFRMGKLFLSDYILSYTTVLFIHEYFGHFTAADYAIGANGSVSFNFNLPPPFGKLGGFARYDSNVELPIQDRIFVTINGLGASQTLAKRQQRDFLLSKTVDYRKSFLYLFSGNGITIYVFFNELLRERAGDISDYINELEQYGRLYYFDSKTQVTFENLFVRSALMSALDPFNYHAAYSLIINYLIFGNTHFELYTVPIGEIQYVPYYYIALTIFGLAHHIKNYFVWNGIIFDLDFFFHDKTFDDYGGLSLGIYNMNIFSLLNQNSYFSLDIFMSFSRQPLLITRPNGEAIVRTNSMFRALFQIGVTLQLPAWKNFGFFVQMGWKTAGYWEGYFLEKGFLFQIGLRFYF